MNIFIFGFAEALEFQEEFEGAGIGAFQAGFVAGEEWQRPGFCEGGIGVAERAMRVVVGVLFVQFLRLHEYLVLDKIGFDGPEASLAPFGGDHFLDEIEFDEADGLELLDVGVEHFLKLLSGFFRDDDTFGVEAVSDGVPGGDLAAGFGFGSVGFSAVGAGGVDFSLGGHGCTDWSLRRGGLVDCGRIW